MHQGVVDMCAGVLSGKFGVQIAGKQLRLYVQQACGCQWTVPRDSVSMT